MTWQQIEEICAKDAERQHIYKWCKAYNMLDKAGELPLTKEQCFEAIKKAQAVEQSSEEQ